MAIVLVGLAVSGLSVVSAQDTIPAQDTAEVQEVHIDYARTVEGKVIDTSQYQFLSGDVELSQEDIFMYCDSAVIIDSRKVYAYGNVVIQKGDTLTIYADTLEYLADSLEAVLTGEVVLTNGSDQLWTSRLYYDLEYDLAYYDRSAVMLNDSTQISSNVGLYWLATSLAKLTDSVVVIGEDVTVLTDSMYYKTSTQWAEFIARTLIIQDKSQIYCESGFYDVPGKEAVFTKNAKFTKEDEVATADTIYYSGNRSLVRLIRNARYEDSETFIESDEIRFYDESGEVEILGNAHFEDSTRTVFADNIFYNERTEFIRTTGKSNILEEDQILEADDIDYDQVTGTGVAKGNVIFTDTAANTIVVADTAFYNNKVNSVLAYGAARSMLKNLMEGDTLFLTADTLRFTETVDTSTNDTIRYFKAFPDVRLFKGTMQGLCDSLLFNSRDSVFRMLGNPILWSDTTQFTSDTIDILLRNEAIDEVRLIRNGLIINVIEGTFYNQIKGRNIVAHFENDEVRDLFVKGNAESIYYARDEADAFIGVNRVAASEIKFTFENKQLGGIRLFSQPDGTLQPMKDVNHSTLRLEGFVWRQEERPKSLLDLF